MLINELIKKIESSEKKRSKKERKKLLVSAHILDKNNYFDSNYFSRTTVEKSKHIATPAS